MPTSAEVQALTAKVDALLPLATIVPQLITKMQELAAQVAANATVSANHADDVAEVNADSAKLDQVIEVVAVAQAALAT